MMISTALSAALAGMIPSPGPRPEVTTTFTDWIAGCDNARNCRAIALEASRTGPGAPADHLEILIEQAAAHDGETSVTIKLSHTNAGDGAFRLTIDNVPVRLPVETDGRLIFRGRDARSLLSAMRAGDWIALAGGPDGDVARASLAGLTAALVRIDDQQGKIGTPGALVKVGTLPPYDDLPGYRVALTKAPRSDRPPAAPDAKAMADLHSNQLCNDHTPPVQVVRLDHASSLMILANPCDGGAYNLFYSIFIIDEGGTIRPAVFDFDNGISGDGPGSILVNAAWDDNARVLESFTRHRGIGDCGRVDRFIWSGQQFRLSEQFSMPECRLAFDRIRTWQAEVSDDHATLQH